MAHTIVGTTHLYLPLSERMLSGVLADGSNIELEVSALSVPHIGALMVLQSLPGLPRGALAQPERILVEAIAVGNAEAERDGASAFAASALRMLDRKKIREGNELLADFGIQLLDHDVAVGRSYLTVDGHWDGSFKERYRTRSVEQLQTVVSAGKPGVLTEEQTRVFREFVAQPDDHMHVQGYAGTGKSLLIKSLLSIFAPAASSTLVLAERQRQLDALLGGGPPLGSAHARTFERLIESIVPPDITVSAFSRMRGKGYSRAQMSDDSIARGLGVYANGRFSPANIVQAARGTVGGYCYSGDDELNASHIPDWCISSFDDETIDLVLHYASEFWSAIVSPASADFQPPVRGYHKVKWAALNRLQIPAHYTHVLIDECHDLPKPMLQILDCSPQAVITFGDEYQNLRGRSQQRADSVRQRPVTHSVRSGRLIEQVLNPIISAHPSKIKLPFVGNPERKTELVYYDEARVPPDPVCILVADIWGLFEWAQRLANQGVEFELLRSQADLAMFVNDCIELYQRGTRARHGALFRFDTWHAVGNTHHDNAGFQRIDRLLAKGYSIDHWASASKKMVQRRPHNYALGLVEDARNREFESVMLTPDVAEQAWGAGPTIGARGSTVYVAVTRARRRLLVPLRLGEWVEEISKGP